MMGSLLLVKDESVMDSLQLERSKTLEGKNMRLNEYYIAKSSMCTCTYIGYLIPPSIHMTNKHCFYLVHS